MSKLKQKTMRSRRIEPFNREYRVATIATGNEIIEVIEIQAVHDLALTVEKLREAVNLLLDKKGEIL